MQKAFPNDSSSGFIGANNQSLEYYPDKFLPIHIGGNSIITAVRKHGKFFFKKRLKPEFQQHQLYIDSLKREFEIGYKLEHPNIVRYVDTGKDEEGDYIIVEYIDGITLSEYKLSAGKIKEAEIIRITKQLLDALKYLHSYQMYHTDIKPENILLTRKGHNVRLIDFGHANSDMHRFKGGGTEGYYSKEQVSSPEKISPQSDIFSVGKVVAFLDTGNPESLKLSTKRLTYFVKSCTEETLGKRFQDCDEALTYLEKNQISLSRMIITISLLAIAFLSTVFIWHKNANQKSLVINSNSSNILVLATKLSSQDSIYATNLGASLYLKYKEGKAKLKNTDFKELGKLHSMLLDSVSASWYKFSSKFTPLSPAYESAYKIYTYKCNESNMKIMSDMFK